MKKTLMTLIELYFSNILLFKFVKMKMNISLPSSVGRAPAF
jgi:hypothetical protein